MRATSRGGRRLRLAHRGDWREAPENSLEAVHRAASIPWIDGVEIDVRASADGVPVVIHDDTLARVQRQEDRVASLTARQLASAGVPSLATVLAALPSTAFVDIELKTGAPVDAVVAVIEQAPGRGPAFPNGCLSSFEIDLLRSARRLRPTWPRWLNADDLSPATIRTARELGCEVLSVDHASIDAAASARARAAGLGVAGWTVTDPAELARVESLGVVATCIEGAALERAAPDGRTGRTVGR